jgi:hypothetical protein
VLAPAAAIEVLLLLIVGANLTEIALVLFCLQLVCATLVLSLSLRKPPRPRVPAPA